MQKWFAALSDATTAKPQLKYSSDLVKLYRFTKKEDA